MSAFFAIVRLTCKAAFRSYFFLGTELLILGAVLLMPLIVKSDGTAISTIKITLEYSITVAAVLLSISAAWLGASEITEDVEDRRLQMIAVKPVARPVIYLAKFTGIVAIHALLLLISGIIIYALTSQRIATSDFAPGEKERLNTEIWTARRIYKPDSNLAVIDQKVEERLKTGLENARKQGKQLPDDWQTVRTKTGEFDEEEIRQRLRDSIRLEEAAIVPGERKSWTYSNLPDSLNGPIRIRYKIFFDFSRDEQERTHGVWGWQYHFTKPESQEKIPLPIYFVPTNMALELLTMQTTEFEVEPTGDAPKQYACARGFNVRNKAKDLDILYAPNPKPDTLMVKDGKAELYYLSLDKKGRTVYFTGEGPEILVPVSGFFDNFCRTIFIQLLLIMSFAALGLAFSACLSRATGIFLTLAYLIWGIATRFVLDIFKNTAVAPHNFLEKVNYYAGETIDALLFDPSAFAVQEKLSSGELIEFSSIAAIFFIQFIVKVLPFFLLGLWIYSKRELALAGKEH